MGTTRKQKDIESSLERKGFRRRETDHSYFVYYRTDGRKSRARTKTSHGRKEIGDSLLGLMAKQCKIQKSEFLDLIDCPLDQEAYEDRAGDEL